MYNGCSSSRHPSASANTPLHHLQLRAELVQHFLKHVGTVSRWDKDKEMPDGSEGTSFASYVEEVAKPGTWCGLLELRPWRACTTLALPWCLEPRQGKCSLSSLRKSSALWFFCSPAFISIPCSLGRASLCPSRSRMSSPSLQRVAGVAVARCGLTMGLLLGLLRAALPANVLATQRGRGSRRGRNARLRVLRVGTPGPPPGYWGSGDPRMEFECFGV